MLKMKNNKNETSNAIALLTINNGKSIYESEIISVQTLEILENLIFDEAIEHRVLHALKLNFEGLVIVKIYPEGDVAIKCKNPDILGLKDRVLIKDWLKDDDHKVYVNEYYRLDLDDFILLFRVYFFNKSKIFVGHILEKTLESRVQLMEMRQDILIKCIG